LFDGAERAQLQLRTGRIAYVHKVRGKARVNGLDLHGGDALKTDDGALGIAHARNAEVLVFDLPPR